MKTPAVILHHHHHTVTVPLCHLFIWFCSLSDVDFASRDKPRLGMGHGKAEWVGTLKQWSWQFCLERRVAWARPGSLSASPWAGALAGQVQKGWPGGWNREPRRVRPGMWTSHQQGRGVSSSRSGGARSVSGGRSMGNTGDFQSLFVAR